MDWHWDPGRTTYHFLGMAVDYDLEGTVVVVDERAHSLGEFQLALVSNQFRYKLLELSWCEDCT